MDKNDFTPKKSLDEYFTSNQYNAEIYEDLVRYSNPEVSFDPEEYFHLLYKTLEYINTIKQYPSNRVMDYLWNLSLSDSERIYFMSDFLFLLKIMAGMDKSPEPVNIKLVAYYKHILPRHELDLLSFIEYDQITNMLKRDKVKNTSDQIASICTTLHYALLHYYKQKGGYELEFEGIETTKREAMRIQGKKYGVGGEAFALAYYKICYTKDDIRISKANIPNIKNVILMLIDFPKAKSIAEDELKNAELLP